MKNFKKILSFLILFLIILISHQILFASESEEITIHKTGTYDEGLYSRILVTTTSGSSSTPTVTGDTIEELKQKCQALGGKDYNSDTLQTMCAYNVVVSERTFNIPLFLQRKMKTPKATVYCKVTIPIPSDKTLYIRSCSDLNSDSSSFFIAKEHEDCLNSAFKESLSIAEISSISSASNPPSCKSNEVIETVDTYSCGTSDDMFLYRKGVTAQCDSNLSSSQKLTDHPIKGNMYATEEEDKDANSAYCIQPGKKYKDNQTYYLDTDFDISNCSSSNSTFECGLAAIMNKSNEEGYGYAATLTALRLWTAYKSDEAGDGWWEKDGSTILTSGEKLYTKTATAIINSGYTGIGKTNERALIYGLGSNGQKTVTDSFNLFKDCVNGTLPAVSGGVSTNDNYVDFTDGSDTVVIYSKTPVDFVSATDGVNAEIVSSSNMGTYYAITINLKGNCKIKDFNVSIKTNGDTASIKRYRPKGGSAYQVMMVYDKSGDGEALGFTNTCGGGFGSCPTELKVKTNISENCEVGGNKGNITDPTLNEILDPCRDSGSENEKREKYNTETKYLSSSQGSFCKLYCREETQFIFMDEIWKTTEGEDILAGRHFDYDLPGKIASAKVSTIVKGKKDCESVIDYDKWETTFEKAQESVLSAWSNMKYWEALKNDYRGSKEATSEGECCSGTIDYTCWSKVGGTLKTCCNSGYNQKQSCSTTVYVWGSTTYTKCTKSGCSTVSTGEVTSGSVNVNVNCTCSETRGNSNYAQQQYLAAVEAYKSARNYREQLYIDIQNCNLYNPKGSGDDSIEIIDEEAFVNTDSVKNKVKDKYVSEYEESKSSIKEIKYEDTEYGNSVKIGSKVTTTTTFNEKVIPINTSFCEDCIVPSEGGGNATKKIEYLLCSETGNECKTIKVDVPINDRALIHTGIQADYWQDQNYSVQAYTGDVAVGGSSEENYEDLSKYIYPITLNTHTGKYYITVNFLNIIQRHQKSLIPISYAGNGIYTCYYNVINKTTKYEENGDVSLGFIFRPIDLTSVFPWDRKKGENWENAQDVIDEIEDLNDDIWTKDKEYTFTLTPSDRRVIREYNFAKVGLGVGYTDMSLYCEEGNIKCKSYFLDTNNMLQYTNKYDTSNGRSKWK